MTTFNIMAIIAGIAFSVWAAFYLERTRFLVIAFLLFSMVGRADVTLTKNGISWTLDGSPVTGYYADGSPWAVGPITLKSYTTAGTGTSGMMVNPPLIPATGNISQGYDTTIHSGYHPYSTSLNYGLGLPKTVGANSSIVTALSTNRFDANYGSVHLYQVLTVVESAPANGAFRPGIYAASKASLFTTNNISWAPIRSLAAPSGLPTYNAFTDVAINLAHMERKFDSLWYEGSSTWDFTYIRPAVHGSEEKMSEYGQYLSMTAYDACLLLHLDYTQAQKRQLLLYILQSGLDVADAVDAGIRFNADGGHMHGRLPLLLTAAAVFNDAGLKAKCGSSWVPCEIGYTGAFQELQVCFIITAHDVTRTPGVNMGLCPNDVIDPNVPELAWTSGQIGLGEWGFKHAYITNWDNAALNSSYRENSGGQVMGADILIRLLGLRSVVGNEALHAYGDRFRPLNFSSHTLYGIVPKMSQTYYNLDIPPDTNAPVISAVSTNSVTTTNAVITWMTDELATSGMLYGTTTNYGITLTNSSMEYSHSLTATGLTAATLYYFKVVSTDASNNVASATGSFTTDITNRVATPVLPAGFSSLTNINITITCATDGASIFYTVDGSTPTSGSTAYAPCILTNSATVKAIATKADWTNSAVASESYDVFGIPAPDPSVPTASLGAWFMGASALTNSSGIATWYDVSANARHATAQTAPLRVNGLVNSQPAIRFDGSSQYLTFDMPVNGLTGMTIFIVASATADQDTLPANVGDAALFWNETADWGTLYFSPLQRYLGIRFGTGATNSTLHTRPASIGTTWTISTALKSNAVDRVFTNGVLAQTFDWPGRLAAIANCRDVANIGRGYDDNTYYAGDIAEILIYTNALSPADQQTVEGYLSYKYGLSGPAAHYPPVDPTFSLASGSYPISGNSTNVTVSCDATNTLRIWFSSGSPTILTSNTPAVITVTNGQTLNAFSTNAINGSGVTSASYVLTNPPLGVVEAPSIYPGTSTNLNSVSVLLSCTTPGATILWTTNYWASQTVGTSLGLTNSAVLIARATNLNWTTSGDSWAIYTVTNLPPLAPETNRFINSLMSGGVIWR